MLIYDLYLLYVLCKNYDEYKKNFKQLKDDGLKLLFFINREYKKHLDSNKIKPVEYETVKLQCVNDKIEIIEEAENIEIIEGYTDRIDIRDNFDGWLDNYSDNRMNSFDTLNMYCD